MARSTYYYYLKQKETDKYESEKQDILEIYNKNKGRYGYRRICAVMRAKGYTINHKTVLKLMKTLHLRGKQSKNGKYHSYKGEFGKVADNLLRRNFCAEKLFEKLTTDVTEFKIGDEKVYLSPVLDMFNREIISYSSIDIMFSVFLVSPFVFLRKILSFCILVQILYDTCNSTSYVLNYL